MSDEGYDSSAVFHAGGGWFFNREPDGSVRICAPGDTYGTLDADTWASVVAHVSIAGDNSATFAKAGALHRGEPLVIPPSQSGTDSPSTEGARNE